VVAHAHGLAAETVEVRLQVLRVHADRPLGRGLGVELIDDFTLIGCMGEQLEAAAA
jgi:hypothetical protein